MIRFSPSEEARIGDRDPSAAAAAGGGGGGGDADDFDLFLMRERRKEEEEEEGESDLTFFFSDLLGESRDGVLGLLDPSEIGDESEDFFDEKNRPLNTILIDLDRS